MPSLDGEDDDDDASSFLYICDLHFISLPTPFIMFLVIESVAEYVVQSFLKESQAVPPFMGILCVFCDRRNFFHIGSVLMLLSDGCTSRDSLCLIYWFIASIYARRKSISSITGLELFFEGRDAMIGLFIALISHLWYNWHLYPRVRLWSVRG